MLPIKGNSVAKNVFITQQKVEQYGIKEKIHKIYFIVKDVAKSLNLMKKKENIVQLNVLVEI